MAVSNKVSFVAIEKNTFFLSERMMSLLDVKLLQRICFNICCLEMLLHPIESKWNSFGD